MPFNVSKIRPNSFRLELKQFQILKIAKFELKVTVLSKCIRVKSSLLLRGKNVSFKRSEFHSNKSEILPISLFEG